jgi:hypothetical protein
LRRLQELGLIRLFLRKYISEPFSLRTLYLLDVKDFILSSLPIDSFMATLLVSSSDESLTNSEEQVKGAFEMLSFDKELKSHISAIYERIFEAWREYTLLKATPSDRKKFNRYKEALFSYHEIQTGRIKIMRDGIEKSKRLTKEEKEKYINLWIKFSKAFYNRIEDVEWDIQHEKNLVAPDAAEVVRLKRILYHGEGRRLYESMLNVPKMLFLIPLSGFEGYPEMAKYFQGMGVPLDSSDVAESFERLSRHLVQGEALGHF